MINKLKKGKKKYIVLFLILILVLITPFTYSRYTSKYTKHIIISATRSGYNVVFDKNGGEGSMETQNFESGISQKLNKCTFTKQDYVFWKWNTHKDGTGISYEDEAEVTDLTDENGKTITLYAIYSREKFSMTGDIVFDGKDGKNPYIDTKIYLFNAKNIHKDFEVSFEIKSRGLNDSHKTNDYPTMMSAIDERGQPWPGMAYRIYNEWDDQLIFNASGSNTINKTYHYNNVQKVTLKRINSAIYLSMNDGVDVQLLDASLMHNEFDYPVVFGASLDGNMQPQRWFEGTLSNLRVVVTEPNTEIGTIKYYPNGGAGNNLAQHVSPDIPNELMKNTYTNEGYIFNGWNTKPDGSGETTYTDEENVILDHGQVLNLYAQWKRYKYNVEFNANNGTDNTVRQEFDSGVTESLKQSEFTKDGYSFAFWNTKQDGSGVSYEDSESVTNLCAGENETLTLYAMYEKFSYDHDGDIEFNETSDFNGKRYIDTHIYLFSRKNVHKDFRISFEIKAYNNTNDYNTIVSALDESGIPYPGFVFRLNNSTDEYNFEVNSSESREIENYYPLTTKKVVIRRENDRLFLELDDGGETQIIDYSTLSKNFYYPVTVGASLDENFVDWRHFIGTISNLHITLYQ